MRNQFRQLEQMLVIQTMGFDMDGKDVKLSLASAAGSGRNASCLTGSGVTVAAALERIRNYSFEEELFCAHVSHVLIGEAAAEDGIENFLSYISHSPELRIDLPVYLIKGSGAEEAISGIGNGQKSVTELMASMRSALEHRGDSSIFTAAEIMGNLERCNSTLICALEYAEASEKPPEGQEEALKTLASYGYGVIKDYRLVQFIDREDAVGVGFLLNKVGICDISIEDPDGNKVTLEIDSGESKVLPIWDKMGNLSGIDVQAKVSASVLETEGHGAELSSAEYTNFLVGQLEAELSGRIGSVLALSCHDIYGETGWKASSVSIQPCIWVHSMTPAASGSRSSS